MRDQMDLKHVQPGPHGRSREENLLDDPLQALKEDPGTLPDEAHEQRIAWWREARLGLFIHWGPYALPAGEWNGEEIQASYSEHIMLRARIPVQEYEEMAERFNPTAFDAGHWVRTAKRAGLKYIIFTAKHHDGFAMYDSKVSDYSIVKHTPFGRDPLRELEEACRVEGIVLGIYYSHAMDWHDPDSQGNTWDYPDNIGAYDEVGSWIQDESKRTRFEHYLHRKSLPQVRELLTEYGKVGLMWFDCGGKLTREQGELFFNTVHALQQQCLVNSRVWKSPLGDYANTSDNQLETWTIRQDWENIITLNDSWGYKKSDSSWKRPVSIIRQMIDVVSKNGNLVINVGPTATGEWDPVSEEILLEVGEWLNINGDSIYGAGASPTAKPSWGRCTLKGQTLYLHLFDVPADRQVVVPGLLSRVKRVYPLAGGADLAFKRLGNEDLIVLLDDRRLPADGKPVVLAVEYAGPVTGNPVRLLHSGDGEAETYELSVFDSEINGSTLRYDTGKKNRDNLLDWIHEQDYAFWRIRTSGPCSFVASLDYGCGDEGGGSIRLEASGHPLLSDVHPTGGAYEFQPFELGVLYFPEAGEYRLELHAERITGTYLMQPRKLLLKPLHAAI
ncbi:alpha-L-fucosidase [Paenibacillus sp. KQZ6P-2]|uniref:alpha-L-fucosidase n=1 Tax=Paenibacillus mangrovi TaxID=2931978 RepID=A0A9X2B5J5_9BACL|nr:alpha-L-fucosidase [Paenibacillus mangrovi]MCJ8012078.1 alpha-L-fucosidase [Paenibacillus mangrovi]